ncbi:hypothetical protein GGR54DRAFT_637836 [Hypoxylon sp. NC1633]|nr:hypothetical protein GGR54DRAFT_637836 [Hypoxylon sp. NC1633]
MTTPVPTPALPPPPGETSNFANPRTLVVSKNIAMGISIPLATIFFFLRAYVRIWVKRTWIVEDWLALIAWAGTVAVSGITAVLVAHNGGIHKWDLTTDQAHEAYYWFNIVTIHYGITICIAKLSVLCLYRRIFSPMRRSPFDISIVFLLVLHVLFYTATTIVKILECVPRAKIVDEGIPGTCVDISWVLDVSGIFNTITDLIVLLLPVKAVWKMKMQLKKKVTVVLVFTFGSCAPIFSLVGLLARLRGSHNPDKSWFQADIMIWGLAELTTGVLCVSFPELGALFMSKRSVPSPTIANGEHRHSDASHAKQPSHGFSALVSHSNGKSGRYPYMELEKRYLHDVRGVAQRGRSIYDQQPRREDIIVTREVRVDSERLDG